MSLRGGQSDESRTLSFSERQDVLFWSGLRARKESVPDPDSAWTARWRVRRNNAISKSSLLKTLPWPWTVSFLPQCGMIRGTSKSEAVC
jgi:hypothetical protein